MSLLLDALKKAALEKEKRDASESARSAGVVPVDGQVSEEANDTSLDAANCGSTVKQSPTKQSIVHDSPTKQSHTKESTSEGNATALEGESSLDADSEPLTLDVDFSNLEDVGMEPAGAEPEEVKQDFVEDSGVEPLNNESLPENNESAPETPDLQTEPQTSPATKSGGTSDTAAVEDYASENNFGDIVELETDEDGGRIEPTLASTSTEEPRSSASEGLSLEEKDEPVEVVTQASDSVEQTLKASDTVVPDSTVPDLKEKPHTSDNTTELTAEATTDLTTKATRDTEAPVENSRDIKSSTENSAGSHQTETLTDKPTENNEADKKPEESATGYQRVSDQDAKVSFVQLLGRSQKAVSIAKKKQFTLFVSVSLVAGLLVTVYAYLTFFHNTSSAINVPNRSYTPQREYFENPVVESQTGAENGYENVDDVSTPVANEETIVPGSETATEDVLSAEAIAAVTPAADPIVSGSITTEVTSKGALSTDPQTVTATLKGNGAAPSSGSASSLVEAPLNEPNNTAGGELGTGVSTPPVNETTVEKTIVQTNMALGGESEIAKTMEETKALVRIAEAPTRGVLEGNSMPINNAPVSQKVQDSKVTKSGPRISNQSARKVSRLVRIAYDFYQAARYSDSKSTYAKALAIDPLNRDGLLGSAAVATAELRYHDASGFYRKWLSQDPNDEHARAGLLALMTNKTAGPEVQSDINILLREHPGQAYLHHIKGNFHAAKSDWLAANQAYLRAFQLEDNNAGYSYNLAISYEYISQPVEAVTFYEKAISLSKRGAMTFDPSEVLLRIQHLQGQ